MSPHRSSLRSFIGLATPSLLLLFHDKLAFFHLQQVGDGVLGLLERLFLAFLLNFSLLSEIET